MPEESFGWHRSEQDRVIAGVCGGLAESWRIDATLIRVAWVLLTLLLHFLAGLALYLAAWFVLPVKPAPGDSAALPQTAGEAGSKRRLGLLAGWLLIAVGAYYLADHLTGGFVRLFVHEFRRYLWPILLIAIGGALLIYRPGDGRPGKDGP